MLPLAIICACLLVGAQALGVSSFIIIAILAFLALVIFSNDEHTIPLLLFFMPFSTIIKLSPESISFSSVAIALVFVIKLLKHYDKPMPTRLIISVCGLGVISLIANLLGGYGVSLGFLMFFGMLFAFPLMTFWAKDRLRLESCVLYYSLGILLATVLSFAFSENDNLLSYIVVMKDQQIVRHCGFYGDPNFYASQIVTATGLQLLIISKREKGTLINFLLALALTACGAVSVSKSYVLCLAAVVVAWLFCLPRSRVRRRILLSFAVLTAVAAILIACGLFSGIIDQYIDRFSESKDLASLTTNRVNLWIDYLRFFLDNPMDLLIGQGYANVFAGNLTKASHNTLIQCVYQFGLLGSAVLLAWFFSTVRMLKGGRVKASCVIVLLLSCFSMWMGLDFLFFDDFFLTVVVFALGLRYLQNEPELPINAVKQ